MELFAIWLNRCCDAGEKIAARGFVVLYLAAFAAVLYWLSSR